MHSENNLHPFADVSKCLRQKRYRLATRQGYFGLLKNVVAMVLLVIIGFSQIFMVDIAEGINMYPSILDGDVLLGYRLDSDYVKNDVVVYDHEGKTLVGRVVAKSGDKVNITEEGQLFVNGTEQKGEIVFPTYPGEQSFPLIVPENAVYILGDNRTHTTDSRSLGAIDINNVKATVVSIFRKRGI